MADVFTISQNPTASPPGMLFTDGTANQLTLTRTTGPAFNADTRVFIRYTNPPFDFLVFHWQNRTCGVETAGTQVLGTPTATTVIAEFRVRQLCRLIATQPARNSLVVSTQYPDLTALPLAPISPTSLTACDPDDSGYGEKVV